MIGLSCSGACKFVLLPMGQKKLLRFEAINSFSNVLQYPKNMPGQWKYFFKNNNPIVLELACGKGEYTVGLAELCPNNNYIGVDIKGNRLWVGAKKCLDKSLHNAGFLRTQIGMIQNYFEAKEVNEIWITFPDPQLRKSKANKRLTHPDFLRLYKRILLPGGRIHLKTDSPDLYYFTKMVIDYYGLQIIEDIPDVYKIKPLLPELNIHTHYENLNIAQSDAIFYVCFSLPDQITGDDEIFNKLVKNEPATFMEPVADRDNYVNEQGNVVFTGKFLLERGECCGNGCMHCPYEYIKVREPLRSKLLASTKL